VRSEPQASEGEISRGEVRSEPQASEGGRPTGRPHGAETTAESSTAAHEAFLIRQRPAELFAALFFLSLGLLVVLDSRRLGASWADDGPQAGYFPFYIGLLICLSALVNGVRALRLSRAANGTFVAWSALRPVLCVLVPTAIYAALIGPLGVYAASLLFVGFFMRWLGGYPWWKVAAVGLGQSALLFVLFEIWFQVPLPKGPLEALLGLA
jgi:putative tricarboxylic transport membrane protein